MQAETGKVRGEAGGETVYLADLINFYGKKAEQVHRRGEGRRALAADEDEEAAGPVPALSGRRRDQPLELPADPLARRRASRAAGRRRGRDQALRGDPARPRRDRRGMEAATSAAPTCSTSSTAWARPDRRSWTRSTSSSSPARTAPRKKVLARAAETPDPRQRRARRQGPDDRAARAPTWRRRSTPPPGARSRTPARSACRSSASTSRSRSTTSSSQRFTEGGGEAEAGHRRPRVRHGPRRDDLPAADRDRRGARRRRPREGRHGSSPAASASRARATGTRRP